MGSFLSFDAAQTMRETASNTLANERERTRHAFLVERTLAAECDFLEDTQDQAIRLGVGGAKEDPSNPLGLQGVRIGSNGEPLLMKDVKSSDTSVEYSFEKDTYIHVFRRGDDVLYHLKTPTLDVTRTIHPMVRSMWKPIGMGAVSRELDLLKPVMESPVAPVGQGSEGQELR